MNIQTLKDKWKSVAEEVALTANLAPYPVPSVGMVKVGKDNKKIQKRNSRSVR